MDGTSLGALLLCGMVTVPFVAGFALAWDLRWRLSHQGQDGLAARVRIWLRERLGK